MLVQSHAQSLPSLIIQRIAIYLRSSGTSIFNVGVQDFSSEKKRFLLPLMGVCKHWNGTISTIFYCHAKQKFGSATNGSGNSNWCITLRNVGTMKRLYCLKTIKIYVRLVDFIFVDCKPLDDIKNCLETYGPLLSVNGVSLSISDKRKTKDIIQSRLYSGEAVLDAGNIEAKISDFFDYLDRLLPNRRIFQIRVPYYKINNAMCNQAFRKIIFTLPSLFLRNTGYLDISGLALPASVVKSLQNTTLSRIVLADLGISGGRETLELLCRCRETIEYILISKTGVDWTACMIRSSDGRDVLVYPRLKELRFNDCTGTTTEDEPIGSANPFPALQILQCICDFPFNMTNIFEHIKPYIRVLDLEITNYVYDLLHNISVLKPGSFINLEQVSFRWKYRPSSWGYRHGINVFVDVLNMSQNVHTVTNWLPNYEGFSVRILPNLIFSDNLRTLDLRKTFLNISETVQLFNGFKRLHTAVLSINDESTDRNKKMPTEKEIRQFRARFKGSLSSIHEVCIMDLQFYAERRAGAYVVLMTSVLPNIKLIKLSREMQLSLGEVIWLVNKAKQRPVYKRSPWAKEVVYKITPQEYGFYR